jgi:hypothetical protein
MIEGERERWVGIKRDENTLRESFGSVWGVALIGSELFCWFKTGREASAVMIVSVSYTTTATVYTISKTVTITTVNAYTSIL